MVKDILISAMYMLNLSSDASSLKGSSGGTVPGERFLRYFNLVCDEIASDYRPETEMKASYNYNDAPPAFYGISPRVLAYGTAAEYCISEGLGEAEMWDKRYKDGIAMSKKQPKKVARRPFIGGGV